MLAIAEEGDESISFNETFKKIITVAQQVISINDKIYDNFTKIIVEQQPQQANQVPPPGRQPNAPPPPARDANRPRDQAQPGQPQAQPANNQSFSINTNTFIDDEEYGLNIEDLDM